ncbi:MAG TPA: NAD(P)-binding domain-containing protein [Vicinamibacterales bacterium]|nr:NAD(P)-binding domain-containing protein [Vicinamibacterales bacterium]
MPERVTTVVIGAGHAGLAASRCLSERSIEHVVLERGDVANSWRRERWDSLRLLTPNWQSRLPGYGYAGSDPDGFMTMAEVIDFVSRFAVVTRAPVRTRTEVTSVRPASDGYVVTTPGTELRCRTVVLATGACNVPSVPALRQGVPASIESLTPFEYRSPQQLPDGGVLVVGASATGVQLADEIRRSGRPVTLSVGEHVRLPRIYRGRDVLWWMDASGVWNQRYDEIDDLVRARGLPSPQLVGTPERSTLDLNTLSQAGVQLVGRLAAVRDGRALFSGGLRNLFALADLKMDRLLDTFDEWARATGRDAEVGPPERFAPTRVPASTRLDLDLRGGEIRAIIWATGFRPDYNWLDVPVVDHKGHLRHEGGVVEAPGLYAIGLPVLRRRKSSFIHGAEDDARDLVDHLARYLANPTSHPAAVRHPTPR